MFSLRQFSSSAAIGNAAAPGGIVRLCSTVSAFLLAGSVFAATHVVRYVDTGSAPGGDGTTAALTGDHRAYASLSEWESSEQANLVTADEAHTVVCAGSAADTTRVTVYGWTTDADHNITITTDPAATDGRHDGTWGGSGYRLSVDSAYAALRICADHTVLDGLMVSNADPSGVCVQIREYEGSATVANCVIKGGRYGIETRDHAGFGSNNLIVNNIIYGCAETGIYAAGPSCGVYNNTAYNCNSSDAGYRYGISLSSSSSEAVNNIVLESHGSGGSWRKDINAATQSHNISSDSTASGTGSLTLAVSDGSPGAVAVDFASTTPGSEDFHLIDTADNAALESGLDLSSVLAVDIDGEPRPADAAWEIGADEFTAAVSAELSFNGSVFLESTANDGSIDNSNPLQITIDGDAFAGNIGDDFAVDGKILVSNLPSGLTLSAAMTATDTLSLTITGAAASHADADNAADLTLSFQDAAFAGGDASVVANSLKDDFLIDFNDPAVLSRDGDGFIENAANDGAVDNHPPLTITLTNDSFTGIVGDDFVSSGRILVSNLPDGLTAAAELQAADEIAVVLTGNADHHADADDVTDLSLSFQDSAFACGDASKVSGSLMDGLSIDFNDPVTLVLRYVNTASSSGGDGTTNATGGGTRAYPSLFEWEAAEQKDLVAANERHRVVCSGTAPDTIPVEIYGWDTDAVHYLEITTDADDPAGRHSGVWDETRYRLDVDSAMPALYVCEHSVLVDGLQIRNADSTGDCLHHYGWTDGMVVSNCLIRDGETGVRASAFSGLGNWHLIYNNIIYGTDSAGIWLSGIECDVLNNTVFRCNRGGHAYRYGISVADDGSFVVNNIVMETGAAADIKDMGQRAFNISSDASADGFGSLPGRTATDDPDPGEGDWVVFRNITGGAEDLRLRLVTENDAIDMADVNADAVVDGDIELDVREGYWDAGADEAAKPGALNYDSDGDGFPNNFDPEPNVFNNSVIPDIYVDASVDPYDPEADGSESHPFPTIIAALVAADGGDIICLAPGAYDIGATAANEVMITSTAGPEATVVDGDLFILAGGCLRGVTVKTGELMVITESGGSTYVVDCVFDGCGLEDTGLVDSRPALFIDRCVFKDESVAISGMYDAGISVTNSMFIDNNMAFDISDGAVELANCTFKGNDLVADCETTGMGMSDGAIEFIGCVFTGNTGLFTMDEASSLTVTRSCLDMDYPGVGNLNIAGYGPSLTPDGHLLADSPCVDFGSLDLTATIYDFNGEERPFKGIVDAGADEFVDTDGDGMPDWWEEKYFGGLSGLVGAGGDFDGDTVPNIEEYENGTDPADFIDADGDGLPDWWETENFWQTGFDGAADIDGDGVDNLSEHAAGTNPMDDTFIVVFHTGIGGYLDGITFQYVASGGTTTPVGAVPYDDRVNSYRFVGWDIGETRHTENPLIVENITSNMTFESVFAENVDSDNDTIYDHIEAEFSGAEYGAYALNPNVHSHHAFEDPDGDRFPTIYELVHGTDPGDPADTPDPDFFIDAAADPYDPNADGSAANPFATINALYNADNGYYGIARLEPGEYDGYFSSSRPTRLMIMSRPDAEKAVVDGFYSQDQICLRELSFTDEVWLTHLASNCVLLNCDFEPESPGIDCDGTHMVFTAYMRVDGCVFKNASIAIYVDNAWATATNSLFMNNQTVVYGGPECHFVNCSFKDNAVIADGGNSFQFANCAFENNGSIAPDEHIGGVSISNSCVNDGRFYHDGQAGNIIAEASFTPDGHLTANSPCVDGGADHGAIPVDIDGEARPDNGAWDIGADEFIDTDGDGMPDWWEDQYGLNPADPSDAAEDGDNDNAPNLVEYNQGTNPLEYNPYMVMTFTAGSGGSLDGETTQYVDFQNSFPIPVEAVPDAGHMFICWNLLNGYGENIVITDNPLAVNDEYLEGLDATIHAVFSPESDSDGLPDDWEMAAFGTLAYDGAADPDGDGVTNADEYANESDPSPSTLFDDPDNDGYPTIFEIVHGTDENAASSTPTATVFVDTSAAPGGDGSQAAPFDDIAAAVAAAGVYDIIELAAGTYTGDGNRGISIDKPLMIRSANGPRATVIDGGGVSGPDAFIVSPVFSAGQCVLSEISITNIPSEYGDGYYIHGAALGSVHPDFFFPRIRFNDCVAANCGAGIWTYPGRTCVELVNCVFMECADVVGCPDGHPEKLSITNCTMAGGALWLASNTTVVNSVLWSDGLFIDSGAEISYSCVKGGAPGIGNFNADPMLDTDGRLLPGSPCIDAGTLDGAPTLDIDGDFRRDTPGHPNAADIADVGADEYAIGYVDEDNDGMDDNWETANGLDPNTNDSHLDLDNDGLTNIEELALGTAPDNPDTDGDGLSDGAELSTGTDPLNFDTDGDTMPDGWEVQYGLDPLGDDRFDDLDGDSLDNMLEYEKGTYPNDGDSDDDGLNDYDETCMIWSEEFGWLDPLDDDTDGDGLKDGFELETGWNNQIYKPSPWMFDSDYDGLSDYEEYVENTNPCLADTDGDGLSDYDELNTHNTYPDDQDSDDDLIPDGWEVQYGLDPLDGSDDDDDPDNDGLTNILEHWNNGDPHNGDTDGDLLLDGVECYGWSGSRVYDGVTVACHYSSDLTLVDTDYDGLDDKWEYDNGTSPTRRDTDGDTMPDAWEHQYGLNPRDNADADTDADIDGLSNADEYDNGTDPTNSDTDGDTMPDGWELQYGLNPLDGSDAIDDDDDDGLSNAGEYENSTDPTNEDSDGDTILDGREVAGGTNPLYPNGDEDGDGMPDVWEYNHGLIPDDPSDAGLDPDEDGLSNLDEYNLTTLPDNPDTDGDGMGDGWEDSHRSDLGTDPLVKDTVDTDGDGIPDVWESFHGLDPNDSDTDGDGMEDGWEYEHRYELGTDPLVKDTIDTDNDGMPDIWEDYYLNPDSTTGDAMLDPDHDGLLNFLECLYGTDPDAIDTDGDNIVDGAEFDSDGDGLTDLKESNYGTDPLNPDSDGDGVNDGNEIAQGSNPWDDSDGGQPPPEDEQIWIKVSLGDHSGSHSEYWKIALEGSGNSFTPGRTDDVYDETFKSGFAAGGSYPVSVAWVDGEKDYDYTAQVYPAKIPEGVAFVLENDGLLGKFNNKLPSGTATIHLVKSDLPTAAPAGGTATSHCDTEDYWDILGDKVVGLTIEGGNILRGVESSTAETPCFVSRTEGSGESAKTRYFMVADKEYTPAGGSSAVNSELDKYWFNQNTHDHDAGGLHNPDSAITISLPNYRAFESAGLFDSLFNDEVISVKAKLRICLYDLDDDVQRMAMEDGTVLSDKEEIKVRINGEYPANAVLTSVSDKPDRKWQVLELEFDADMLNFPAVSEIDGQYPAPEVNTVTLELDRKDIGWAVEVDWAVIQFDAVSPTFLVHGAGQSGKFWEGEYWYAPSWISDTDIINAFKDKNYPYYCKIDIHGVDANGDVLIDTEHWNYKGGAKIVDGGKQLAEIIPKKCRQHGAFSFHAIGHSKGGLWLRSAIQQMRDQNAVDPTAKYLTLCSLTTLCTPHCGSVLADYATAMFRESEYQDFYGLTGYIAVSGNSTGVPADYESLREQYWPQNPNDIFADNDKHHFYWNDSYSDLDAVSVNDFNLINAPFLRNLKNFDTSSPDFHAYCFDADHNNNNHIDDAWFGGNSEWYPLQFAFFPTGEALFYDKEAFFNTIDNVLANTAYFDYIVNAAGEIEFSNVQSEANPKRNDLFVTVDSQKGTPTTLPGQSETVADIFTTVGMDWWDGNPSATSHGTIADEVVGEHVLGDGNHIKPLR